PRQLSRRACPVDLRGHAESRIVIHDDMGQTIAAIYAPPGWARAVGLHQSGLDVAAPGTIPNWIRDGHMLGIGEHRGLGKDCAEVLVHPRPAAIAAVMIGQRDKVHRPSALLPWQFCNILSGT